MFVWEVPIDERFGVLLTRNVNARVHSIQDKEKLGGNLNVPKNKTADVLHLKIYILEMPMKTRLSRHTFLSFVINKQVTNARILVGDNRHYHTNDSCKPL